MNVTYWLRKSPQPAAVLADDKRIEVPRNRRAYRDLTETIKAMDPDKLTCLDAQGNVIRSIVLESEAGEEVTPVTPEQSDLQLFAKLLADAYDKGASKMQPIVDSAMAFVERGGSRLAKVEAENDRLRAHIHKLNLRIADLSSIPMEADEETTVLGTLAAAAVQGMAAASQQSPAPVPITKRK